MDSQEFINHPIFNFTGEEKLFKELNSGNVTNKPQSEVSSTQDENTNGVTTGAFKTNREIYKKKITEVELIKDTFDNM